MKHRKAIKKELSHINNIDDIVEYIVSTSRDASVHFLDSQLMALAIEGGEIKELLDEDHHKTWNELYDIYTKACDMFEEIK